MTGDNKDGHDEGDVGAKDGKGQTAIWKKPSPDSLLPSTQAPLLSSESIPRSDSKRPILHLWPWQIPQF